MKAFKRNAVIITVVLFVAVAAYLNWSYSKDAPGETQTLNPDAVTATPVPTPPVTDGADNNTNIGGDNAENKDDKSGLFFEGTVDQAGYFAEARINRQAARDAAVQTLATVNESEGASQEVLDAALKKITDIAAFTQQEAEVEALIKAKGFADCVAFISEDGIQVTVPAPQSGLSAVDVAKITDVVTSETVFSAEQLNVIEVR